MPIHRRFLAVAAAAFAFGIAAPAAADFEAGVRAWRAGDYKAAIAAWRPLAHAGNANAQYNMGQAFRFGQGVPVDLQIARSWFERAAQQGHEQAQNNLGLLLFQNGDRKSALYWIGKAADRGDARAQYIFGTALFNGDGVAKDWPRAYALMSRAAAQGLPAAASSLAQMDKQMLLADRERGAALARQMAKGGSELTQVADLAAPEGPRMILEPAATAAAGTLAAAANTGAAREAPRAGALKTTRPKPKPASVQTAKASLPTPAPSARALPRLARPGGRWRVQLGAYDSEGSARSQWMLLARKVPSLAGMSPSYERFGAFTRLRAGPLAGKGDADRLCASARAAGQACFTVAP